MNSIVRHARSFCRCGKVLAALIVAVIVHPAQAAPPSFTGQSLQGQIPQPQERLILNLRQQGVIAGSAPLRVAVDRSVIVNGEPTGLLVAEVLESGPGSVCVAIDNIDFSPGDNSYALSVTLFNLGQQTAGPVEIPLIDAPGPGVSPTDPACGDPNTPPVANAGVDQTIADTNGQPGEPVTLNGSASTDANTDNALTYTWTNAQGVTIATGATPGGVVLPDGVNLITLTVTDDSFDTQTSTATDTVTITVAATNQPPTANAGGNRTIADSDGQPGETVTLDGAQSSDPDGSISTYQWFRQIAAEEEESLGSGVTLNAPLPDGANVIRLQVTDNGGATASAVVTLTVTAPAAVVAPTANAGADRSVADSDSEPGEAVTLDGSQSADADGTITTYQWFRQTGAEEEEELGAGVTLNARLPDGANAIRLQVTDNAGNTASDTVQITVGAPLARAALAELQGLTFNQTQMAIALDRICTGLTGREDLTTDQQDLLRRCDGLVTGNTPENQRDALDELNGEDFAAARTQTLLFANLQYVGVMDRLMALRGGARGLSLAGLNIMVDGKPVPLASMEQMVRQLLGGGASSDADEPGGLLNDKWGFWLRGNYSFGDKRASAASPSFDADQWAIIGGIDYRITNDSVFGGSLSYGKSNVDFNPAGEGSLDTESWAGSLYGSLYAAKNFYFDGILNVASSSYDALRNITYVDGTGLVTADAHGDTDGMTVSGGLSGGYDFLLGGFTISPNLGVFYIDATIDEFAENGAGGLDLMYDEQKFRSLTANLGLRFTYAWNLPWGVVLPHLRADFVREFEDDVDVFGVRFAADPDAGSAPPILVETDNPDTSYWRFAGGLSAQFSYGISGYVEYQRLESFQFISFEDVSIGLRVQRSF